MQTSKRYSPRRAIPTFTLLIQFFEKGPGVAVYSIWLPFILSPNEEFDFAKEVNFDVCGYSARLCRTHGRTGLSIAGFPNEDAARVLLPQLNAAIVYTVAHSGPSMRLDWEPVPLFYKEGRPFVYWKVGWEPDFKLSPFDASRCAIYRSNKRFSNTVVTIGHSGISHSDRFLETLQKGLREPGLRDGIVHEKLKIGADLFLASAFEMSFGAQFLTLCTVLEVLAPQSDRPKPVRMLIAQWMQYARERAEASDVDPEEARALRSLDGWLGRQMRNSIKTSLENYVRETLSRDREFESQADKAAKKIKDLYDRRSSVVHKGHRVESEDLNELHRIVRMALIAAMRSS